VPRTPVGINVRVLVTGAGGLLGGRLASLLSSWVEVVAGRRSSPGPAGLPEQALDILSASSIEAALETARPEAVLHSAALADADRCEADPALAEAANVKACETLARACRRRGIRLVAVSTDLVFDGRRPFVLESDPAVPILVYGRTKLLGEQAVLDEAPGSAVVRVALVHGRGHGRRGTASEAVEWALRAGRPLRLFTDQFRTTVDPESVADAVRRILDRGGSGRYHLGGPERLSRLELGLRVAALRGLPVESLEAITQAGHPLRPPRPDDVSMDASRARRELDWTPRPLDAGILEGRSRPG
jgi:dTDP-4-dehydrorhamnose reductase